MAPKKVKVSLQDFLADTTSGGGSWADDIDDLPSAPSAREDRGYGRPSGLAGAPDRSAGGFGGGFGGGDRADRSYPPREEIPLPDRPPYTAFVGNLAFEVIDADVAQYFAPHTAVSIRLVTGHDGKPKGFGYVEFESLDGLKDALSRSGGQLAGRAVRVSVAEPPKESGFGARRGGPRRGGDDEFGAPPSAAEEASQWRRAGPLPPAEPSAGGYRGGPRRGDSYLSAGGGDRYERGDRPERSGFGGGGGGGGFENMSIGADGSRAGFGSKFSNSPAPPSRGASFSEDPALRREPREPRAPREPVEPGAGDNANDWRTGKAVSGPPAGAALGSPSGPRRGSQDRGAPGPDGARTPQLRRRESNMANGAELDAKYSGAGERMGFGSKFAPGAPAGSGSPGALSPTTSEPAAPGGPQRRSSQFAGAGAAAGGEVQNWRTLPRKAPTGSTPTEGGAATANGPAAPAGSASGATSPSGEAAATPAPPAERKRLQLKPRSSAAVLETSAQAAGDTSTSSSKSNPFGTARPVDVAEREREIETKLETKREEERKEREAKRAEEKERKAAASAASTPAKNGPSSSTKGEEGSAADASAASAGAVDPVAASELANGTDAAAAGDKADASTADAPPPPPTPRVAPPTGAWGGGRKASGALAKPGSTPAANTEAGLAAVTDAVAELDTKESK
ncbi:Eukaryotic translation initiation factor 4B [Tilletia horrida]|uniref:Eukaryotic translation initiation factor 4B n=1 Tax=Tilletia horrida TaxID=155126 RepID=A0AAN6JWX4_9BASI|nr:Eukaryotic translation initiation factor 4B [Tilletia horrida]